MNKILCFCVLALTCQLAISQSANGKWRLAKVGFSVGFDQDMIRNMDHTMFAKSIKGNTNLDFENITYGKEDVVSMICENPNLRLEATLLPPFGFDSELRFSVNYIQDRIDAIHFSDSQSSLYFDTYTNEISLESSLLFRIPLSQKFRLYAGPGMNYGKTFGATTCIEGYDVSLRINETLRDGNTNTEQQYQDFEYYDDCFDIKNSFHTRMFAHFGFGWTIKNRIELGMEWRYGIGAKITPGVDVNRTTLHSNSFNIRYVLKS